MVHKLSLRANVIDHIYYHLRCNSMVSLQYPRTGTPRIHFTACGQSLSDLKIEGDSNIDYPEGSRLQTVKSWGLLMGQQVGNSIGTSLSKVVVPLVRGPQQLQLYLM